MSVLDRLRAGLFSDRPKYGKTDSEAYKSLRRDAQRLADEIEAEVASKERACHVVKESRHYDGIIQDLELSCGCHVAAADVVRYCPKCGAKVVKDA